MRSLNKETTSKDKETTSICKDNIFKGRERIHGRGLFGKMKRVITRYAQGRTLRVECLLEKAVED